MKINRVVIVWSLDRLAINRELLARRCLTSTPVECIFPERSIRVG